MLKACNVTYAPSFVVASNKG